MSAPLRTDDPMMDLVRLTASRLVLLAPPPASLQGSTLREANERRARFLHEIAGPLIDGEVRPVHARATDAHALDPQIQEVASQLQRITAGSSIAEITGRHMPDVPDLLTRITIAMRLWAGYMDAAKVIDAVGTRYELNNRNTRLRDIPIIESRAAADAIYAAGVEATPHYKWRVLGQAICREGVPAGSIVLRDWED